MKEYYRITTDVVMAEPCTRKEFEDLIDWHPPLQEGESPDDKGYRIEDALGTSWMTVEQFNKSHTVGIAPWMWKEVQDDSDVEDLSFKQAVEPAIRYLIKHHTPHTRIVIDYDKAELLQGLDSHNLTEVVPD